MGTVVNDMNCPMKWGDLNAILEKEPEEYLNDPNIEYDVVVSYGTNSEGKKTKITRVVRRRKIVTREFKSVIDRRNRMTKFGNALKCTEDENKSMTIKNTDEIQIVSATKVKEKLEEEIKPLPVQAIKCRNCGGDHFTSFCSNKKSDRTEEPPRESTKNSDSYVPPWQKNKSTDSTSYKSRSQYSQQDENKIKISNLSEQTTEREIEVMVAPFARPLRIFLIRDRETKRSKGFAFVTLPEKEDVQKVIDGLDGQGFDYSILSVEVARPRVRDI